MNAPGPSNGDVEMWEEQDENGPEEDDVPTTRQQRRSSSESQGSAPSPASHTRSIQDFCWNDENSRPKVARQAPPVEIPSQTRLKIKVKRLHAVAEWKWVQGGDDTCGICRMPFEACCVDCQMPGEGCPLVVGVCKHPFHMHCIQKWTEAQSTSKPQCPLCRQEWKYP